MSGRYDRPRRGANDQGAGHAPAARRTGKPGGTTLTAGMVFRPSPALVRAALNMADDEAGAVRALLPALTAAVDPAGVRDMVAARALSADVELRLAKLAHAISTARKHATTPALVAEIEPRVAVHAELQAAAAPLLARKPPTHSSPETAMVSSLLADPEALARMDAAEQNECSEWNATLDAHQASEDDPTAGQDEEAGAPLPGDLRSTLEATAGAPIGDVRVRQDAGANALAGAHDARAVTVGQTIHLGAGQGDPATRDGQRLLAHETAHTVQNQGSDAAPPAAKPLATTTPADPAEREADRFADAALGGRSMPIREQLGPVAALDRDDDGGDDEADTMAENAYMTVRAYDERGTLLDLWSGPAYFHGALPSEFIGKKQRSRWGWTRAGEADPEGARLKVDSDAEGKRGVPVASWAPDGAAHIGVSFRGLRAPFGRQRIEVDPDAPLSMIGRMTLQTADGAESADPEAPGVIHGPAAAGTTLSSGDLVIEQRETETQFWIGASNMTVRRGTGKGSAYAFTVRAQTSPRQRVVDVVGTADVQVDLANDADGAQLLYHLEHVPPGQVPAVNADALFDEGVLPEIQALSDGVRCRISMGEDVIHIEATEPGAQFAYWVDPEWSGAHGEERAVHIVATPGVRVDQVNRGALDGRRLMANPIYVQNPDLVPKQGTPIDPSTYLGADSFQYGDAAKETATVYTGTSGVTLRDAALGVAVTIAMTDPTVGARFAWHLERPEAGSRGAFRALVGPGVAVHVVELDEPTPTGPPQTAYQDFGVEIDLHEAKDPGDIPPQGTPLDVALLANFPARQPDSREYRRPMGTAERVVQVGADVGVGFVPGVGDMIDLAEATSGQDKWGNELSMFERVVAGLAALLPFIPGAVARVGRFASKTGLREAGPLAAMASKLGKTEDELEVFLAHLRNLDDGSQGAARRVEAAIRIGGDVDPADLARVEEGLSAIGLGRLPPRPSTVGDVVPVGGGPRVPVGDDYPIDAAGRVDDTAGGAGAAARGDDAPPATPAPARSPDLVDKERELHAAVTGHYKTVTGSKKPPGFTVEVILARAYAKRFGSEKARAVFVLEDGKPVIYARFDATTGEVVDEAAHLAQLADPAMAADMRFLDEANLAGWDKLSVGDRLGFYQRKLDVEIDAKRRTLEATDDAADRKTAAASLRNLEDLQAEVASISPDDLARMNAGVIPAPAFLDQPARMFAKHTDDSQRPARPVDGDAAKDPGREVGRSRDADDYSHAYTDPDVKSVEQIGDTWKERTIVTTGYQGKVAAIVRDETGTTIEITVGKGRVQKYTIEPGAEIPDEVAVGATVTKGETLAREVPREYRHVRVTKADGTITTRGEILSAKEGQRWVQRGEESTRRGAEAEAAARAEVDVDLAKRTAKKTLTGSARLPHNVGGGGFDDVIVEFTGSADAIEARIRIREVKNYPNRHVPLSDFTAIHVNLEQNLAALDKSVDQALDVLVTTGKPLKGFEGLSPEQLKAIARKLRASDFDLEIVLGADTLLGEAGHHAAKTLPALEAAAGRKITVSKLGQ